MHSVNASGTADFIHSFFVIAGQLNLFKKDSRLDTKRKPVTEQTKRWISPNVMIGKKF